MAVQQVGTNSPDGTIFGLTATEKIAFFGGTPVVQQTAATAVVTTAAVSTSTNWGFSSSGQANAIVAAANAINTALTNLGLVA